MKLQRYLLIDENKGAYFGEHSTENRLVCEWYLRNESIGIKQKGPGMYPLPEDFLTIDDSLILMPSLPKICLDNDFGFEFNPHDTGADEINCLIGLISSHRVTHVFYSSEYEDGSHPEILTFSSQNPSKKLYKKGKKMQVRYYL